MMDLKEEEDFKILIDSIRQYAKIVIKNTDTSYDLLAKLGWNYYDLFGMVVKDLFGNIIPISSLDKITERIYRLFGTDFETAKELYTTYVLSFSGV